MDERGAVHTRGKRPPTAAARKPAWPRRAQRPAQPGRDEGPHGREGRSGPRSPGGRRPAWPRRAQRPTQPGRTKARMAEKGAERSGQPERDEGPHGREGRNGPGGIKDEAGRETKTCPARGGLGRAASGAGINRPGFAGPGVGPPAGRGSASCAPGWSFSGPPAESGRSGYPGPRKRGGWRIRWLPPA